MKTGDNIAHFLARNRAYDMLLLLIANCKKDNLKNPFKYMNHYREVPLLTLLRYKPSKKSLPIFSQLLVAIQEVGEYDSTTASPRLHG